MGVFISLVFFGFLHFMVCQLKKITTVKIQMIGSYSRYFQMFLDPFTLCTLKNQCYKCVIYANIPHILFGTISKIGYT